MRVQVTIPVYLEKHFESLSDRLGLSRQDTFLYLLTDSVTGIKQPSSPTARTSFSANVDNTPDLYITAPPEPLKRYTFVDPGSCLRGEEIGEYHEIQRGDLYAWQKFSRHSKEDAEGWETGKNGKLCAACHPIAYEIWFQGDRSF